MTTEEMNDLVAEVEAEEVAEAQATAEAEQQAQAEQLPQVAAADPGMVTLLTVLVRSVGGAICIRYRVSPLTDQEAGAIGGALADVAAQYDLGNLSPRAAAWLGLGIATAGVAIPRMDEYRKRAGSDDPSPADDAGGGDQAAPLPFKVPVVKPGKKGTLPGEAQADG